MVIAMIKNNDMLLITAISIIMMGIKLTVMIMMMITVVTMTLIAIGTLRNTLPRLRYDNSYVFNLYVSWRMFPETCLLSRTLKFT